jgi:hypothetical protein
MSNRDLIAKSMSEAELQANVIDAARKLGWRIAHFRPAKTEKGWRTPVEADGKGFPDLVLANGKTVVFAELKSQKGRVEPEQWAWIDALMVGMQCQAFLWRPSDWMNGTIESVLSILSVSEVKA